jgi:hypothetical protein
MGRVPQVDPDQLAALRRLRAAFGDVEVLAVIDDAADQDQAAAQGGLFDQDAGVEGGPGGHLPPADQPSARPG